MGLQTCSDAEHLAASELFMEFHKWQITLHSRSVSVKEQTAILHLQQETIPTSKHAFEQNMSSNQTGLVFSKYSH